jgi:hypothetical protein
MKDLMNKKNENIIFRVNLDVTKTFLDQVKFIQLQTDASSVIEVIRRAVTIYAALEEHKVNNCQVFLRDKTTQKEIRLCFV